VKVLGSEHPDTSFSANILSKILYFQGKYKEVEAMHQWALRSKVDVTVVEDPDMDFTKRIDFTYSPREMQETGNEVKILVYI
jgi:peroxiredoxin